MEPDLEPYQVNIGGTMKIIPNPGPSPPRRNTLQHPNSQPFVCLPVLALH